LSVKKTLYCVTALEPCAAKQFPQWWHEELLRGFMRFHLAIIVSLISGSAMAEENGDVTLSSSVPVTSMSVGRPHVCSQAYPAAAIEAHAEGTTLLAFKVTAEGSVKDPTIARSSGNEDLDDAALQCVTRWRYKPATQDGKPVEVKWQANVVWKMGEPPEVRRAEQCFRYRKDQSPVRPGVAATTVTFRITPDGVLRDAVIAHSSGDQSLDDAAILCVAASHFDTSIVTPPPGGLRGHLDLDWAHMPPMPPVALAPPK
jgi:TonB family protein